ncbi:MAG: hypothetical protein ACK5M1_06490 [Xanthomarina gelatinilytica]|uniref:hypothetical protein n=1 Tax=Xanthomarina gelatinilytica TaxID=1137281 RepID=UPI003A86682D
MNRLVLNRIEKAVGVFLIIIGLYNLKITYFLYKEYCLLNSKGFFPYVDGSIFPEREWVVSLFLLLLGSFILYRINLFFKVLSFYVIIIPLYTIAHTIIIYFYYMNLSLSFDFFYKFLALFGMMFLTIVVFQYYYKFDWIKRIEKLDYRIILGLAILLSIIKSTLIITENLCW